MVWRNYLRRIYAKVVNDKRSHPKYSWGWLNRVAEEMFWTNAGASLRPQYAWAAVVAAAQARALGHADVALLEFGVAGGSGLLALQEIAAEVSRRIGVRAHVYGFDTGSGLPEVRDPRDLPQVYKRGDFCVDLGALGPRLDRDTQLILGNLSESLEKAALSLQAPVGFVSFDVDLYSSTRDGLGLFRNGMPLQCCLPRVVCYFDDIMGITFADITGERLAIAEYNQEHHPNRSISPVYGLRYQLGWPHKHAQWPDMMFWAHFLDHPHYGVNDALAPMTEAPLSM
jgi:hypothetical protein